MAISALLTLSSPARYVQDYVLWLTAPIQAVHCECLPIFSPPGPHAIQESTGSNRPNELIHLFKVAAFSLLKLPRAHALLYLVSSHAVRAHSMNSPFQRVAVGCFLAEMDIADFIFKHAAIRLILNASSSKTCFRNCVAYLA